MRAARLAVRRQSGVPTDLDIVVAVRDRGGYVAALEVEREARQRAWKRHPFVGQQESGYLGDGLGRRVLGGGPCQLARSFDWLVDKERGEAIADRFLQHAYPVQRAGDALKAFPTRAVKCSCKSRTALRGEKMLPP